MTLIAGLGNPGSEYYLNRHNIGFLTIDYLVDKFSAIEIKKNSFYGELYKSGSVLFLKPSTYMNLSGKSILAVKQFYKTTKEIVIHDDLDLTFGALKYKIGGGNGGHNGLKSIDTSIGKEYLRVRMGIGKPQFKSEISSYVLSDFLENEQECLEKWIAKSAKATKLLIKEPLERVASTLSQKKC